MPLPSPDIEQIEFDNSVSKIARHAINRVLKTEGGYVNDPSDKGGETKYGISKRWYPERDIANLTISDAAEIYYEKYWLKNECQFLPPCFALMLFDCAVNLGGLFARQALQKALNVKPDGVIGPKTHGAAITAECNPTGCVNVGLAFTRLRCQHYANLVQSDHSQVRFIEGWIDRALDSLVDSIEFAR